MDNGVVIRSRKLNIRSKDHQDNGYKRQEASSHYSVAIFEKSAIPRRSDLEDELQKMYPHLKEIRVVDPGIEDFDAVQKTIAREAAHYVEEMVKLEKKYDELQELYDQLQNTQAMLVQSEKMAALGKLVATVLHEMNTPIGVIQSNLDIASRSVKTLLDLIANIPDAEELLTNPRFQKTLKLIQESQQTSTGANARIVSIMRSLKSFSRLDEAPFQKIDIHECIENVLTLIEVDTKDRIKLIKTYGKIPPAPCYPHELTQVFMNILSNAVKAIEKKGEIRIRTFRDNSCIKVEISDNGCGISPCKIARLFDPDFSQSGSRVKAKLGLFTSYNIMKKHQGDISAKSELGKGSTFTLSFPLNLEEQREEVKIDNVSKSSSRCDKMDN